MEYNKFFKNYSLIQLSWQSSLYWAERLRSLGHMVWLDSVTTASCSVDDTVQYSVIAAAPESLTFAYGRQLHVLELENKTRKIIEDDPFYFLEKQRQYYAQSLQYKHADLPFIGGLLGYWGYELNHVIEPGCIPKRTHHLPDMAVGLYLWSLVIDHKQEQTWLYFHPELSTKKAKKIIRHLSYDRHEWRSSCLPFRLTNSFKAQMSKSDYQYAFNAIKHYIHSGDCYQVNLAQQFQSTYCGDVWKAYQTLRGESPTPFSAYLEMGALTILSHSPEQFLKVFQHCVETKPIKGTRPRSSCPIEDKKLMHGLLQSMKDKAENLMIVDLLRNDLNKHCELNSVKTKNLFALESYANVHHLVSTVTGVLKKNACSIDLLRSAFPGGSVTGVPKIRAMQVIHELEKKPRTAYCGTIGYVSFNDNMDTNISIRTIVAHQKNLFCWGGGAIVSDSNCDNEYEESYIKISNLMYQLEKEYLAEEYSEPPLPFVQEEIGED